MVDATASLPSIQGHLQRRQTEFCIDALGNGPADNFARIEIQNRSQINKAGTNPDVSNIRDAHLIHCAYLPLPKQVRIDRQGVIGIGGSNKRAPGNRPQTELFHDATDAFSIPANPSSFELPHDAAIAITGEFFMNLFYLLTKLLIFVVTLLGVFRVGLIVVAAGSELAYLAGFRN